MFFSILEAVLDLLFPRPKAKPVPLFTERLERKPPLVVGASDVGSRRCSQCAVHWPTRYSKCPKCGEQTWFSSSNDAITDEEVKVLVPEPPEVPAVLKDFPDEVKELLADMGELQAEALAHPGWTWVDVLEGRYPRK